jgi:CRP/FNR family transcriptional regulator, cyclic AMP receptor protein
MDVLAHGVRVCAAMGRTVLDALKRIPIFRELDAKALGDIAAIARAKAHQPRDEIFHQGDQSHSVFIIQAGYLKVFVSSPSGSLSTLAVMGAGEIFGELSLLDGGPRSASVTSMTRVELLVIDREPFLRLIEAQPRVGIAIMGVLARRLRRVSERSDDLAGMCVASRLAKQLLSLAENHGFRLGPSRLRLGVRMSQRELGELVGATRESVNKHLRAWQEESIVTEEGGYLAITNLDLLRSIAAD